MNNLHRFITSITPLSGRSWSILQGCLEERACSRNEILLKEGAVCRSIYFVSSGLCKAYYNQNGREINTAFYFGNEFAANLNSLTTATPSEYFIKTCEKTNIVQLDRQRLLNAYDASPEIAAFGRKVLEIMIARQEEHAASFKLLSPAQRFERLTAQHPEMLQRVSLTQIASYLGMSRETLSRLRAAR